MAFPGDATTDEQNLDNIVAALEFLAPEAAATFLRAEVRRRAEELTGFVASAAQQVIDDQLNEVDVDRVLTLIGTSRIALQLIAAAIVEIGATAQTIADVVGWMDVRPVALDPSQPHLGIDIAYIVNFRALTQQQRWMLHTLAIWAPYPATISHEHALAVATSAGQLVDVQVVPTDLDRVIALGFVAPANLPKEAEHGVIRSVATAERLSLEPYLRYIANSGLEPWPVAGILPEEVAHLSAADIVAATLTNWAVHFAEVIAGPDIAPPPEAEDNAIEVSPEENSDDDDEAQLTPDPLLAALTDEEAWVALEPEIPHVALATDLARTMRASEYVYRLCQLLVPLLRRNGTTAARDLLRSVLESGLICARADQAQGETLLLATQLADLAIDDRDFPRAATFADEALAAAIARRDLRAVGFSTRRVAAIAIRQGNGDLAKASAKQAVALARANGTETDLTESITLLDLATRMP